MAIEPKLYRVSLRLASDMPGQPARKWSNTFYMRAITATGAASSGETIWSDYLRAAARARVYAYQVYATDLLPGTDDYEVRNLGPSVQRGTMLTPSGEPYMPKACVAVVVPVSGSRPSRKFWRPGLYESDIGDGVRVNVAVADIIADQFDQLISAFEGSLLDVDGENWLAPVSLRFTTREFGREATADVPTPPPFG